LILPNRQDRVKLNLWECNSNVKMSYLTNIEMSYSNQRYPTVKSKLFTLQGVGFGGHFNECKRSGQIPHFNGRYG